MHVMLDLETLGTRPGSAIRSVGAALFDPAAADASTETFYKKVRSMSCWSAGLTVDADTLAWWNKQPKEVQDELKIGAEDLAEVVDAFHDWFRRVGGRYVWSQGAGFDEPLWTAAARVVGRTPPWKFWDARCTRTIYYAAGFDPKSLPRAGTHHNALDDALHQVKCVQESFKMIKRSGT